ncbi:MAG: T9SS type A sorting domain-containing protein [Saprospiraceae bacterium]|nr:T9SS type A sorting domain-containing protein [Saprospiraceae bacterium]
MSFKVPIPAYIYSYSELGVVAYVQNNTASSKEVIQTGVSQPKAITGLYTDLSLESINITNKDNQCDNNFSFALSIKNLSTTKDTIKSVDFIPVIGGVAKPKVTWSGVLLPGQTVNYNINNQIATVGAAFVNVSIDKINNGVVKDLNLLNNTLEETNLVTFNGTIAGTSIKQGFELPVGTSASPNTFFYNEGVRIFKQDSTFARNASGVAPPYGMGGFGASRYMVFFAFSDGPGVIGASSSVVFDKIDLSNSASTRMSWSYAYAAKNSSSTDKMEVLVSTNCGETWTSVYEKQGEAMNSCTPDLSTSHIPGFFLPDPTQWTKTSVDLSAYDGTPELMIRMKGTAGDGWAYFLDDVNVGSVVATNDENSIKSIAVSPNPAKDFIELKISSDENTTAVINLNDSNGKTVQSEIKSIKAGLNDYTISLNQTPGLYFVEVKTSKGVITKKVIVL